MAFSCAQAETDDMFAHLREDIARMSKQLEQLSCGQASMSCSVERMHAKLSYLTRSEESSVTKVVSLQESSTEKVQPEPIRFHPEINEEPTSKLESSASAGTIGSYQKQISGTRMLDSIHDENERKIAGLPELTRLVKINDDVIGQRKAYEVRWRNATWCQRLKILDPAKKDLAVDTMISFVILSNAIFIGFSEDNWNGELHSPYCYVDVGFTLTFLCELGVKMMLHGFIGHFWGEDSFSNIFDFTLVMLDTVQLILVFFAKGATEAMESAGVPSASLFRIVRLMRVTRIVRLLRHPAFQDLLAMMEGVMMGVGTLSWATVLFFVVVYSGSLLCRVIFGDDEKHEEVHTYFSSVPRSMFTVFRCSFGDCSTSSGTPIPEFLQMDYGATSSVLYSLYMFVIEIGLFNVISAIFVDSTMARAAENNLRKMQERFSDEARWATRVCTVVIRCLEEAGYKDELVASGGHITEEMLLEDIDIKVIDRLCQSDAQTIESLNDLDIDPHDHQGLADVLDPDHSGTIQFVDLMNGLAAMRGQPRRSDIVTVNLMLRQAQERLDEIHNAVIESSSHVTRSFKKFLGSSIQNNYSNLVVTPSMPQVGDPSSKNVQVYGSGAASLRNLADSFAEGLSEERG